MGITINISNEDIKDAEGPDFSLLPTGWYNFEIIDAEQTEYGSHTKNPGKPYDKVSLRIIDGDFAGRRQWVNVPLFLRWSGEKNSPTNFVQFFQSVTDEDGDLVYATEEDENGKPVLPSEFEVPEAEELITRRVTARVRIKPNTYQGKTEDRNEVSGFRAYDPAEDPSPTKEDAPAEEAAPAKAKKSSGKKGALDL